MSSGFLSGNFAPVRQELTETHLEVTGHIPDYLDGRYVRNGPNALGEIDPDTYEWFTATGMVHGVRLRGGRAEWYRNRWVRTRQACRELGEAAPPGPIHAGMDYPMHTNVIGQAGRTFVISEAGSNPHELTHELEPLGPCDFDGTLPRGGGYVSHPHRDPTTGEWHAVSYLLTGGNRAYYTVLGTDARIRKVVEFSTYGRPIMHDFALTENYVIIYDLPLVFDLDAVLGNLPRRVRGPVRALAQPLLVRGLMPHAITTMFVGSTQPNSRARFPVRWDPSYPARIGVLPRTGTAQDLRWYDVEPCHVWHTLNAFEADGNIVIDFCRYPKMYQTSHSWPNPSDGDPTLDRWTINPTLNRVGEERLDDRPQEFPQVTERVVGRPYRYGYTVGAQRLDPADQTGLAAHSDTVFKHDLSTGHTMTRHLGVGAGASEFVFLANPDGDTEDDGVLMGYVYNGDTNRSDLTILNGNTLEPVATVHLPTRVPFGFHGNWLTN